jgi:chaperonin GroES
MENLTIEISIDTLNLIGENLLVKPIEKSQNSGGLIIPENKKEKPILGKVIKIGNGLTSEQGKLLHLFVQVNNTVLFNEWSGKKVEINNENYLIIKQSELIGYAGGQ